MAVPQKQEGKEKVSRVKIKKKLWFKILGPKMFGNKELGETYLPEPSVAVGRTLRVNLKDLTGNVRDQNGYVVFQITSVAGMNLQAVVLGYELTPAYVKRMVRKSTIRMDDYVLLQGKEGKNVVAKATMITLHKVQRSVQTALRAQFHAVLQEELDKGLDVLLEGVFSGRIQAMARKRLAKVYPLKELALRSLRLVEGGAVTSSSAPRKLSASVAEAAARDTESMHEVAEEEEALA